MFPQTQHILVIDSDEQRRRLSEEVLSAEGFAVTAVADGFSAIRAASAQHYALAVAALRLPGTLDGPGTLRQLRARQPALKALYTGELAARAARPERVCDEFISVPFDRRELLGCVFELLQREAPSAASVAD